MSIEVNNLAVQYGARKIFQHINLEIVPGEILTILGPNGAGKTTLLNTLAGLLQPSEGEIQYDGKTQREMGARELAQHLGYVPQSIESTFDFSVLEYVVTGCAPRIGTFARPKKEHFETALEAIKQMGIEHLAEQSYRQISGGERQQVSIARVLAQKPTYVMMDEPTSHLDYGNQICVLRLIQQLKEQGYGVIFTTHNPEHALLLGGKVAILNKQGTMLVGEVDTVINTSYLSELYGTQLQVEQLGINKRRICYAPKL